MKKRLMATLLALVMLLSLLPISALAKDRPGSWAPSAPSKIEAARALSDWFLNEKVISVSCDTNDEHHTATYSVWTNSITVGNVYWNRDAYYCDISISPDTYVDTYSQSTGVHHETTNRKENVTLRRAYNFWSGYYWTYDGSWSWQINVTCDEEPTEPTAFPVYVYTQVFHNESSVTPPSGETLTVNGAAASSNADGWITLGMISDATNMNPAGKNNSGTYKSLYQRGSRNYRSFENENKDEFDQIVGSLTTGSYTPYRGNDAIDVNDVDKDEWELTYANAASDYISNPDGKKDIPTWHLDGKLSVYKVNYDANSVDGVISVPSVDDSAYFCGMYTVLGGIQLQPGYTFSGWKIKDDQDGTIYEVGDEIKLTRDVTFIPVVENTPPEPATVDLGDFIQKKLINTTGTFSGSATFEVTATPAAGSTVADATGTVTMTEAGTQSFTFGEISFDEAGTYQFTVKETEYSEGDANHVPGMTYDDGEYDLTIVIGLNEGGNALVVKEGTTATPIIITNRYEQPADPQVTSAAKGLVYAPPKGVTGEFTYPNSNIEISADVGDTVTLLYEITVRGDEGAAFEVTDEDTTLVYPKDGSVTQSGDKYTGTVGSDDVVFYVSKTFTIAATTEKLSNSITAEGIENPINPPPVIVEINKYTVKYELDTDSATPTNPGTLPTGGTYKKGDKYSVDSDYGKTVVEGGYTYTFSGWKLNDKVVAGEQIMDTDNVVLKGAWTKTANEYTVTYTDGVKDETIFADVVKDASFNAAIPAFGTSNPTRTGYNFTGWEWYSVSGTTEIKLDAKPETMPANNLKAVAQWTANTYNVTYKVDYKDYAVFDVAYGTEVKLIAEPSKTGYDFDGWYRDGEKAGNFTMPAEDVTLYGFYQATPITVDLNDLDGDGNAAVYKSLTLKRGSSQLPRGFSATFEVTVTDMSQMPQMARTRAAVYNGEVTMTAAGTKPFVFKNGMIEFEYPAWYTYVVKETIPADQNKVSGVTYDENEYTLTIVVEEGEDGLYVSRYFVGKEAPESGNTPVTIANTYYKRTYSPSTPSSKPKLNTGDHLAYVVGYPDGTVRPNGSITRAEVSAILFRLLADDTRDEYFTSASSFTDVKAGAWYNNSVATLEKAGVIVDTAAGGAFRPNEAITRAELAAMLAQFADAKPVSGVKFTDVSTDHWAYDAIAIAAKMGWIEGYPDGTFRPDATITRAEMMTLVNRALERVPSDEDHLLSQRVMLTFPDCNPGDWFYIAVQEATNSHTYERAATEKNGDEQWIALRDNRDWTAYEN